MPELPAPLPLPRPRARGLKQTVELGAPLGAFAAEGVGAQPLYPRHPNPKRGSQPLAGANASVRPRLARRGPCWLLLATRAWRAAANDYA
jgi:hypothetical protein